MGVDLKLTTCQAIFYTPRLSLHPQVMNFTQINTQLKWKQLPVLQM